MPRVSLQGILDRTAEVRKARLKTALLSLRQLIGLQAKSLYALWAFTT